MCLNKNFHQSCDTGPPKPVLTEIKMELEKITLILKITMSSTNHYLQARGFEVENQKNQQSVYSELKARSDKKVLN